MLLSGNAMQQRVNKRMNDFISFIHLNLRN